MYEDRRSGSIELYCELTPGAAWPANYTWVVHAFTRHNFSIDTEGQITKTFYKTVDIMFKIYTFMYVFMSIISFDKEKMEGQDILLCINKFENLQKSFGGILASDDVEEITDIPIYDNLSL